MRLDLAQLTDAVLGYQQSRFRMETLPAYAVASDGDDFHRWLRREAEPDWERKQGWYDTLRAEAARGRVNSRVRVFTADLTEYERYSCEWAYVHTTAAGEDIRVLRRGEHAIPAEVVSGLDWWLVDDTVLIHMRYDEVGRFLHADLVDATDEYRHARDAAWAAAEPFGPWWARHPELHRQVAV